MSRYLHIVYPATHSVSSSGRRRDTNAFAFQNDEMFRVPEHDREPTPSRHSSAEFTLN
jgi:hypothetical protein